MYEPNQPKWLWNVILKRFPWNVCKIKPKLLLKVVHLLHFNVISLKYSGPFWILPCCWSVMWKNVKLLDSKFLSIAARNHSISRFPDIKGIPTLPTVFAGFWSIQDYGLWILVWYEHMSRWFKETTLRSENMLWYNLDVVLSAFVGLTKN